MLNVVAPSLQKLKGLKNQLTIMNSRIDIMSNLHALKKDMTTTPHLLVWDIQEIEELTENRNHLEDEISAIENSLKYVLVWEHIA